MSVHISFKQLSVIWEKYRRGEGTRKHTDISLSFEKQLEAPVPAESREVNSHSQDNVHWDLEGPADPRQ